MVMGSILGDAPVPYSPDDDEDQLDPLKNQPLPPPPPVNTGEVPFAQGQTPPAPSPMAALMGQQMAQPAPSIYQQPSDYGTRVEGTPRQDLLESRQGQSQYGAIPQAIAQNPLGVAEVAGIGLAPQFAGLAGGPGLGVDFLTNLAAQGAVGLAANRPLSEGLQQVPGYGNLPEPVQNTIQFAPWVAGGEGSLAAKGAGALIGGVGGYYGNQLDQSTGLQLPYVGIGPFNTAANIAGGLTATGLPGRAVQSEAAQNVFHAGMPEANVAGANFGAGLPIDPLNPASPAGGHGIPDIGQGPLMAGGEAPGPGGRLYTPENEPYGYHAPNELQARAQQAYDAAYAATPFEPSIKGEPNVSRTGNKELNAEAARQEVLSGQILPGNYSAIPQEGVMPNRNGTPLAYDPTFSGGSGYRETIAPPTYAQPDMARQLEQRMEPPAQRLEGSPAEASSSVSPPPPSHLDLTPNSLDEMAAKAPTPAEQAGAAGLTGDARAKAMEDFGNTPQSRALSPEAQEFLNSPSGRAATAQRDALINTGLRPGETTTAATGGVPPTRTTGGGATGGGGGVPPAGPAPKGINPNLWQQGMSAIAAPTRILLGFFPHSLRIGVQEIPTHAGAFVNAVKGMAEIYRTGKAPLADAVNHSFTGTNGILQNKGVLLSDMEAKFHPPATQYVNPTIFEKGLSLIPGLDRASKANFGYLNLFRDGIYNQAADFLARTTPNADKAMFEDLYLRASHGTGHSTLPGLRGNSTLGAAGLGPSALAARLQNTLDIFIGSGAPTPFSAGARGEAMRSLMGTAGVMALTSAVGYKLGAEVNLPFNLGPIKATDITNQNGIDSKLFKAVSTTPDLANKTVYGGGGGYDTLFRLFGNVGIDAMNGDHKALEGHVTSFLRGQAGVVPSIALDLLLGENWRGTPYGPRGGDKGMENFKGDLGQGFVNHWGPIAVKSLVDAYNAWGPGGLLRAAPSLGAYEVATSNTTTTDQRNAVKDDARVPEAIRGVNPTELGPRGDKALDAVVKQEYPAAQAQAQANQKENGNPVITKYHETIDAANAQADQRKTDLYNALRDGKLNGEQLRAGREIINGIANNKRDGARNDPEYKDAISKLEQNDVNKALSGYYKIGDMFKTPDGKPDWDKIDQAQGDFVKFIEQNKPQIAGPFKFEITPQNKTNPLDQLYQAAQPMLARYGAIKDDYARSQAQHNNPKEDAFLALLGYGKTQSPQAAQILEQLRANLPGATAPVGARGQGVAAPAEAAAPPQTNVQPNVQPAPTGAAIGPNGRSVAQIAGNPYLSDEERNFYFQSRGLSVPPVGQQGTTTRGNVPTGSGDAFTMDAKGRTAPINGADIAPYAQKWGVPAGPLALLMNHEGNGAHDNSETFDKNGNPTGIDPARWGLTMTTARSMMHDPHFDTRTLTPPLAYDLAAQYISQGMEANRGDAAKAFGSFFIGQGGVDKAAARGGDWVKNADQIAYDTLINGQHVYGTHSMTDFLHYLGLR